MCSNFNYEYFKKIDAHQCYILMEFQKRDHFDITYMLLFSANKRDKWITNLFYVTGNSFRIIDILITTFT